MPRTVCNRSSLLGGKSSRRFASKGVELLKIKRNSLLQELGTAQSELSEMDRLLAEGRKNAVQSLILALAIDGCVSLDLTSAELKSRLDLELLSRNTWGVRFPVIAKLEHAKYDHSNAGAVSTRTSAAREEFVEFVDLLIRRSALWIKVMRLKRELDRTSRRLNALTHTFIPAMDREIRYIELILESRELENIVRQKNTKKRKTRHESC
ncbi:MAG: V-type ATP synthase subunit D [Candidatus Wallbacteria bacterium]|nr:V-type ATP synthase subunit D [Candidatus Wallbacteria bacterium]